MECEVIKYAQLDRCLKSIEKKNLNKYGTSLSWCSMQTNFIILCIKTDEKRMEVVKDWRQILKEKHTMITVDGDSYPFNNTKEKWGILRV